MISLAAIWRRHTGTGLELKAEGRPGDIAQWLSACLPSMHGALGSILGTRKQTNKSKKKINVKAEGCESSMCT